MRAEVVLAICRRDLIKFLRDRQTFLVSLTRPLLWLVGVGFGLRSTFAGGDTGVDFVSFLVPGVATMSVLFTSTFAAISIVWDREFGFLKEMLVAPVPRSSIVFAKMLAASLMSLLEVTIVLAIAPIFGARVDPLGALAALPLLGAFGMAVNALGILIASRMKSFEGFGGIVNFLLQPIFFFSGALYPLEGLPPLLAGLVHLNPMSYAVDGTRGLLVGVHHFPILLDTAVVAVAVVLLGGLAMRSFARMKA
ncbi:ABC transporter permease [Polyangium aurulentum]|uniref:ABC transporter permease n=1 Tax=Polyangium aurulentum TaxID=2567896 RepID=UPI0010AE4A15|nr:ABC transporter permease [Polyangium aurulentum]UQA63093.1 ABC transporter permease [Polyangium aurulentum]